jgi:hypothetical protein
MILRAMMLCLIGLGVNLAIASQSQEPDILNISTPTLVFDEKPTRELPRNFRTTLTPLKAKNGSKLPSITGLETLNASGSSQFSDESLRGAMKEMRGKIWIVDLRKESHGFINGIPISWYARGNQSNTDESDSNILRLENMLFRDIKRQKGLMVYQVEEKQAGQLLKTTPINVTLESAQTEIGLVSNYNLGYIRLGVLDHHRPSDDVVDDFVDLVKSLPNDAWLHFHCRGGKGRTTTFIAMYDMLKNGKNVSLKDIMKRQELLGGSSLLNISDDPQDDWKKKAAEERKKFIESFYTYATSRRGYPNYTWTEWLKNRHKFF